MLKRRKSLSDFLPLNSLKSSMANKIFKVAIYIRLSREDGDKEESSSVTNQRNLIMRFISENMLMMDGQELILIDQDFKV